MRSGTLLFRVSLFQPRICRNLDFVIKLNNAPVVRTEAVDNAKEMASRNFLVRNIKIRWALFTEGTDSMVFIFIYGFEARNVGA